MLLVYIAHLGNPVVLGIPHKPGQATSLPAPFVPINSPYSKDVSRDILGGLIAASSCLAIPLATSTPGQLFMTVSVPANALTTQLELELHGTNLECEYPRVQVLSTMSHQNYQKCACASIRSSQDGMVTCSLRCQCHVTTEPGFVLRIRDVPDHHGDADLQWTLCHLNYVFT